MLFSIVIVRLVICIATRHCSRMLVRTAANDAAPPRSRPRTTLSLAGRTMDTRPRYPAAPGHARAAPAWPPAPTRLADGPEGPAAQRVVARTRSGKRPHPRSRCRTPAQRRRCVLPRDHPQPPPLPVLESPVPGGADHPRPSAERGALPLHRDAGRGPPRTVGRTGVPSARGPLAPPVSTSCSSDGQAGSYSTRTRRRIERRPEAGESDMPPAAKPASERSTSVRPSARIASRRRGATRKGDPGLIRVAPSRQLSSSFRETPVRRQFLKDIAQSAQDRRSVIRDH